MINIGNIKIYLCTGATDMRKGMNGLTMLAEQILSEQYCNNAMFVFRGKRADRIKTLWWDGQGFCLFYKCLDRGKFMWPNSSEVSSVGITKAQLSMLLEGIDWRTPQWSEPPKYSG